MLKSFFATFSVRSIVVLAFTGGSLFLAYVDPASRPVFNDLAKIALGGYLGQLVPKSGDR